MFVSYKISHNFTSIIQELIPEIIPSQKYHTNMCPILGQFQSYKYLKSESKLHKKKQIIDLCQVAVVHSTITLKWLPSAWIHILIHCNNAQVTLTRPAGSFHVFSTAPIIQ